MKNRRWIIAVTGLTGVVVIGAGITYGLSVLSHPATADVHIGQEKSAENFVIDLTPQPAVGKYVTFNYPRGLSLISRSLVAPVSVEDFTFYTKNIYGWTLAIDVTQTPTGNLSDSSSYNLRKNNPGQYSESQILVKGQVVHIMSDTTSDKSFEKVAYLTYGTLLATVSLVGSDASGAEPLQTSFAVVVNSWRWL